MTIKNRELVDTLKAVLAEAGATDIEISHGGKHPRLTWMLDGKPDYVPYSASPSDVHAARNAERELRKKLNLPRETNKNPANRERRDSRKVESVEAPTVTPGKDWTEPLQDHPAVAGRAIDAPGVYDMPEDVYHADPCPVPSLSSSIANTLLDRSARHAWVAHPRLNPNHEPVNRTIYDKGTAAHALILEDREDMFAIIDADAYRTKEAKAARDAAYEAGKTPLLVHQYEEVKIMALAARAQIDAHPEIAEDFAPGAGKPEQTLIWQEGDIWCRARVDWLSPVLYDLKSTGGSAHPSAWSRQRMFDGPDLQAGLYLRGARALGLPDRFRFIAVENEPPFALSVLELDPAALEHADQRAQHAIERWAFCLENDFWPGYPARISYVSTPPYVEYRREEDRANEQLAKEMTDDIRKVWLDWQAPLSKGDAA